MPDRSPLQVVINRPVNNRRTDVYLSSLRVAFEGSADVAAPRARISMTLWTLESESLSLHATSGAPRSTSSSVEPTTRSWWS